MDPPLVNESSFSAANPAAYSLAEIWPFGGAGIGGDHTVNGALRLRMGNSGAMNGMYGENIDGSVEESSVTEQSTVPARTNSRRKKKDAQFQDDSSHVNNINTNDDSKSANGKRMKTSGSRDENEGSKAESESNSGSGNKQADNGTKPSEPLKKDYIHVRARRGQATDSHSLAERARREKISERMKVLQDLVPGCNKVIGKALVLDEIINYIQSLQHQVEFLSMKLEAVNSRTTPTIEAFPHKDVSQLGAPTYDAAGMMFSSHAQGPQSEWLHMQLGGSFERST